VDPNRIELTIDSKLGDVFLAGLLVNSACRFTGLGEVEAYRMELCVVEAVNNAIHHAYHERPGNRVAVSLALYPDRMEFAITDQGDPIPADALETMRRVVAEDLDPFSCQELPENGLGLQIMLEVMDEVNYRSSGGTNTLDLIKRTSSPELPG